MSAFLSPPPCGPRRLVFPFAIFPLKILFIVQNPHRTGHSVFPAMVASEGTASQSSLGTAGGRCWRVARAVSCFEEEGNRKRAKLNSEALWCSVRITFSLSRLSPAGTQSKELSLQVHRNNLLHSH